MKSFLQVFLFVVLFFGISFRGEAQGCSDAGACSIESLTPETTANSLQNEISVGVNAGRADHNIFVLGGHVGYSRKFGSSFSLDTRLTAVAQNGDDISSSGLGDLFVIANYKPSTFLTVSAGVKLPTNKADTVLAERDLPMDYQSSLGTLDLIIGLAWQKSNWLIGAGYQQPLTQNDNMFLPATSGPLMDFPVTYRFERQADVLFRISRILVLNDKLTFAPGLLPILHVGNDQFTDPVTDTVLEIEGSSGLTLNATGHFSLKTGDRSKLGFYVGFPLIVREVRPDGLTRSFVAGVEYGYSF
jgi:hypothetical protein